MSKPRLRNRPSLLGALAALLIAGSIAFAQPATASGNTFLWTSGSNTTRVFYLPNTAYSSWFRVPNGTRFQMRCYLDNAGHRWFWGSTWAGDKGFVTADATYNQTWTPHC